MGFKISVKAHPSTWTVDDNGPANFDTIQGALNNAASGDIIFVKSGIYYEQVVVNKSVSLIGEDRDSTIVDGNGIGTVISIVTVNNVNISGFTIRHSGGGHSESGIYLERSSGNGICHNTITKSYGGIRLYYSSDNVFSGNMISSNNYDGVSLLYSGNNVFSGNMIFSNNYGGVSLFYSGDNVFSGNTITNNSDGVSLFYSGDNMFSGNMISSNNYNGMYFAFSSRNNIIYSNNFNNAYQVWADSTSMNVWNDGDEGNYWSDYTGLDLNRDGIGDTPYVIDVNNLDSHPLMGVFSVFVTVLERETYHVTTVCNSTISEFRFEIGPETGNKIIHFDVTGKDSTVGFCRIMIPTRLMGYPYIVLVGVEEIVPTILGVSNETHVYLYFIYVHSSQTVTIISSKTLLLYDELLVEYIRLQTDLFDVNATYYDLLNMYNVLLGNYSQLQERYSELNDSYSENVQNMRNLVYIFAAATAIFLITTIYLSRYAHASKTSARSWSRASSEAMELTGKRKRESD